MKYVKQFLVIIAITFIGEILNQLIPLPIPASIYGMMLLLLGLITGVIKLSWVKETGKFLIAIMPIMFIPSAVGLMTSFNVLMPILVPVCLVTVITVITVMVATGWSSQLIIRGGKKKNDK